MKLYHLSYALVYDRNRSRYLEVRPQAPLRRLLREKCVVGVVPEVATSQKVDPDYFVEFIFRDHTFSHTWSYTFRVTSRLVMPEIPKTATDRRCFFFGYDPETISFPLERTHLCVKPEGRKQERAGESKAGKATHLLAFHRISAKNKEHKTKLFSITTFYLKMERWGSGGI